MSNKDMDDIWENDDDLEMDEDKSNEAPSIRLQFTVDKKQTALRIDKFLLTKIENATRSKIQQAIEEEKVLVNNAGVKTNYKIRPGDEITVFETRKPESTEIVAEELPLNIAYEDDELLIINKDTGMVVHPGCGNYSGTLVNGLAHYLKKDKDAPELPRVGLVHRIDKNTSGLIVVAKTEEAMAHLAAQFKDHTAHRRYIALVWGDVAEDEGTVIAHIGRHQRFRKKMEAYPDGEIGKEAITHYKVIERFNYVTLLELRLETGRTHQIRVHMKHIGHPLFNDSTYGGDRIVKGTIFSKYKQFIENCFKILQRHALHAKELGITHPKTNERLMFDSELPEDMTSVIEKWKSYTKGITKRINM
ncbi:MAG: RluA family pseudouridine synthase [Flavipsychrobacter sp.]